MQHSAIASFQTHERLARGGTGDSELSSRPVRDGDVLRMIAAMSGPILPSAGGYSFSDLRPGGRRTHYTGATADSDAQYFRRRSAEEGRAAVATASPKVRETHRELAARYARLSREKTRASRLGRRFGRHAIAYLANILAERFGLQGSKALKNWPRSALN